MLASRMARASWGALRVAAWAPGARPGKGRARGALLPPASGCLGFLAERWWLRPAALGLRLPGASPRAHCSGTEKAASGPATGEDAAVEARRGQWGPTSASNLVRTKEETGEATAPAGSVPDTNNVPWLVRSDASISELLNRSLKRSYG